jgi:hypothetical protein
MLLLRECLWCGAFFDHCLTGDSEYCSVHCWECAASAVASPWGGVAR